MKKTIKTTLAKGMAVVMALGMAAVPNVSVDAATKPSVAKKVTVNVGKTKTVKVTSKKAIKSTKWTLNKKKIATLSKKTKKSVTVKGAKAGKVTLTAKVKVGKKTYTLKTAITVKKASTNNNDTNTTNDPTKKPDATVVPDADSNTSLKEPDATIVPSTEAEVVEKDIPGVTIDETSVKVAAITEANQVTLSSLENSDVDFADGKVTFTTTKEYNSGIAFALNGGEAVDLTDYEYVRVKVRTTSELNFIAWEAGADNFWNSAKAGTVYEGSCKETVQPTGETVELSYGPSNVYPDGVRTILIPVSSITGMDLANTGVFSVQGQESDAEITILGIELVKEVGVSGITIDGSKTKAISIKDNNVITLSSLENSDAEFEDGTVTYTTTKEYNSGMAFNLNNGEALDISGYDYIRVKVTNTTTELNFIAWEPGADNFWNSAKTATVYEGSCKENVKSTGTVELSYGPASTYPTDARTILVPIAKLTGLTEFGGFSVQGQEGDAEITIVGIDLVKAK